MTVIPRRRSVTPMLLSIGFALTATACGVRPEDAAPPSSTSDAASVSTTSAEPPSSTGPTASTTTALTVGAADEPEISVVPIPETPVTAPADELPETVKTLPAQASLPESPFPYRRVEGDFDFEKILVAADPLRVATINVAAPTVVSVATNGPARNVPPTATGSTVTLSYQLYSWNSDEFYDGTPAGDRADVVVGANNLPAAFDLALTWSGPNERLIVLLPPRSPGLPNYVPADLAYYAVIDVFAVRSAG